MARSLRSRVDDRVRPFGPGGLVVVGALAVAGVVLALRHGAGPLGIAIAALLAAATGAGLVQLPTRWVGPLWLLALVVAVLASRWTGRPLAYPGVTFLFVGQALGLGLRHHRQERRRARAGLAPSTWDRRGASAAAARSTGLRLVRDDGDDRVETEDASAADVRAAVSALDGRTRTGLSVFRGGARLDVGGDAAGALAVYQCDDVEAAGLVPWSVVSSADAPWSVAEVEVRLVGVDAHLPAGSLTTLGPALAALDTFLVSGERAAGLPWRSGSDVDDLRAVFEALA